MSAGSGVVIDCDGLLVDTKHAWKAATAAVFPGADGHEAGMSVGQLVELHAHVSARERDRLTEQLTGELVAAVTELGRAMPGAAVLLERLKGRPHAIASNAPAEVVRAALTHVGVASGLQIVALASPLRPKPAPDLHLEACSRIGMEPAEAIAFEDSIIGATAARAAGLLVIGVGAEPSLSDHVDLFLDDLEDPRVFDLLNPRPSSSRRSSSVPPRKEQLT
jgi:HAD superfamily hydrolase (TIGR01509 family)